MQDNPSPHPSASRAVQALSVVIPVYNEQDAVRDTCQALAASLKKIDDLQWEIVCVNDGSKDKTSDVLQSLVKEEGMVVVEHEVNRGYGAALKTGIRRASHPWIAIIDADGTYSNEDLAKLLDHASGRDMVVGARIGEGVTYSWIRRIPKFFLRRFASFLAGAKIPDMNSGLRIFQRDIARAFFPILSDRFSFTTSITMAFLTSGYQVSFIPIGYKARVGKSKIKPIRDTIHFTQLILRTGMYFAPMKVLLPLALLLAIAAIGSGIYDIIELKNITEKTVLLTMFSMNTLIFALLADMIQKIWRMRS